MIISQKGPFLICTRKTFLILSIDGDIGHSRGDECHLLGTDRNSVLMCTAFVRNCCYVVLGFVQCVLRALTRCLLTTLRKQTDLECSQHPQRFLCPLQPGIESETSTTATASSSHSAPRLLRNRMTILTQALLNITDATFSL